MTIADKPSGNSMSEDALGLKRYIRDIPDFPRCFTPRSTRWRATPASRPVDAEIG